jgi:PIN domain nuclease of toxin-antitoxin system
MNILLDTHALIWLFDGSNALSPKARETIEDSRNNNFISVVSFWEIAIKISISKLNMDLSMEDLQRLVWENGIEVMPMKIEHTFELKDLVYHHKDPFDRAIFAQSLVENMNIVSCDEVFDKYLQSTSIKLIW